jgi:hypothetical protein
MAITNRPSLKGYFEAGDRPTADDFRDLIDSAVNWQDDKATVAQAQAGTDDVTFMTPASAKASVLQHSQVKSVNGNTGVVVIPPVTTITGNAGTATALQTPRQINGVAFDGTANISLPEDSTAWTTATLQTQAPVLAVVAGYTTVGYRKKNGIVFLEGAISGGTTQTNGATYTLFTLPAGYRPAARLAFAAINLNNTLGRIDIDSAGKVYGVVYNNGGISLCGISFPI